MNTLVLFTTRHGATKKAAEYIAEKIPHSIIANIAENDLNIEAVDNIILGTPVYMGRVPYITKEFIGKNAKLLKNKNFYFFVTCARNFEMNKVLRDNLPQNLSSYAEISCAGGEVKPNKLNLFEKLYCMINKKMAGAEFSKLNYEVLDKIVDGLNSKK